MRIDTSTKGILGSLVYFIAGIFTWLEDTGLNTYVITGLAVFMALDMFLGWVKASVVDTIENPTSKKAKKGILVKSVIFAIPIVVGVIWGALADKESAMKVVNVQLTALLIAEGYSIVGNAYSIYTGEELSEFDAITFLLKKTAGKIKLVLEQIIDDKK